MAALVATGLGDGLARGLKAGARDQDAHKAPEPISRPGRSPLLSHLLQTRNLSVEPVVCLLRLSRALVACYIHTP